MEHGSEISEVVTSLLQVSALGELLSYDLRVMHRKLFFKLSLTKPEDQAVGDNLQAHKRFLYEFIFIYFIL